MTLEQVAARRADQRPGDHVFVGFDAYQKAIDEHYRFYSYGDAMLIL